MADYKQHVDRFLGKVFENNFEKQVFQKLCDAGCSPEYLGGLLFAVNVFALMEPRGFLDCGDLTNSQLSRLISSLRSLADQVEHVNKTRLCPKIDLLAAPPDARFDPMRKRVVRLYEMLPFIMRLYSRHLERFSKFSRVIMKRLTRTHLQTLRLLLYIEESTGSPRYDDTSNLLTSGFLALRRHDDDIPKFFTADALAKLKQRTAKWGLTFRF
jgi:hypothetical protein